MSDEDGQIDPPSRLPRGRGALPPEVVEASQRRRLLTAMSEVAGTKGITDLTVADLVGRAGVARRSFYALFKDKTDCYLEAYGENATFLLSEVEKAFAADGDPADLLLEGMRAYLRRLDEFPVYARAFLLESLRAGPEALEKREEIHGEFVRLFTNQYQQARKKHPDLGKLSDNAVIALIGGINELMYLELARAGENADLAGLEPDVLQITRMCLGLDAVRR